MRGLGHLDRGLLLQAEDLDGPAGQAQAARRERQPAEPSGRTAGRRSSLRNCATCMEMPASDMPSSAAAAWTEPSRTTAEKARS